LGDWLRLLRENEFAIAPRAVPRAAAITFQSAQNTVIRWRENRKYGRVLKEVAIPPPVFILGHWRSGTTHLHNLVTTDERFAFPNNYQTFFPHTFLSTEGIGAPILSFFLPERRPMDNVAWSMGSPQEDEFALCIAALASPYMGWAFPQRREDYDKYLTLRDLPVSDIARWRETLLLFLRKLTWKYRRPLVLKSPPHTCRIGLLLEMVPEARFVHIHRNPYTVFQSSRRLFQVLFELNGLQRPRLDDLDDWILRQYRVMYDVFFEERRLIPERHFHEVGFQQLEEDPIGEVRRLYEALDLPDFGHAEPALRAYIDSIARYKKNEFAGLPADMRSRIRAAWRACFEEWNYPE
jgi:hypothetical protein